MPACEYAEECPFFSAAPGYSPELQEQMRQRYCLGDTAGCARLAAFRHLTADQIPDDLMPTESERARDLVEELTGAADAE